VQSSQESCNDTDDRSTDKAGNKWSRVTDVGECPNYRNTQSRAIDTDYYEKDYVFTESQGVALPVNTFLKVSLLLNRKNMNITNRLS